MSTTSQRLLLGAALIAAALPLLAQTDTSNWTAKEDHAQMLQQLGITQLRPGHDGYAQAPDPRAANNDEAKANPWPDYPAILVMKNGKKVVTAAEWPARRAEIVEDFEREVVGRLPKNIPAVKWSVTRTATDAKVGKHAVSAQYVVGHVDNTAYPAINVDIQMAVVLPTDVKGPVPVLIMFGRAALPGDPPPPRPPGAPANAAPPPAPPGPSSAEMLLDAGWGYAMLDPTSVQADNGAGLTKGIIGLVNKGQPRKPEDWGALRAWSWAAARALDYLQTVKEVDAKKVGIEGVSRYGKAALVTQAFEPRFAIALIGSSGKGGTAPYRRDFGEALENLSGAGEYHWMAGNFVKYGADAAGFGRKTPNDLPVDAHELIALCAPRPTFISYGIPDKGDALWVDQQGGYMATVAASEVYRLLGAKGLDVNTPYQTAVKPAVNVGLVSGQLAWRQHDGGHEDRTNVPYFIEWANTQLGYHPLSSKQDK
ncbi:MAG TPA: hypothetical protein VMH83_13535 [Candidatus Acidoferrum sp.]|nr:hypothetical protein [Candidatus Acidoferrum sp.]